MGYDELMESILTAQEKMLQHSIEANSVTLNGRKYGMLIENLPPNIKPTVFGMAVKADYALPDDYDFLIQYEPPQPKTNYDRIRAMSAEELAEFLLNRDLNDVEKASKAVGFTYKVDKERCLANVIDWLKEEAVSDG